MPDQLEDNKEEVKTEDTNPRRRMVVEEVSDSNEITEPARNASSIADAGGEIKEKVEELQDLTDHIAEDVKESAVVQEEIKEAVEKQEEEFVPPKQAPSFSPMIIIIPGILLLGALLGGIVFYQKTMNKSESTPTPLASPEPTTAAGTPTPSAQTSLTKYSIAIQNGSGIAGEAGKAQVLVEGAGFKVSGTGNADSYTYTKTVVKAKATVEKDFVDALIKTLGKNYTVDKAQTLASTSKDDVQVIVGSVKSAN